MDDLSTLYLKCDVIKNMTFGFLYLLHMSYIEHDLYIKCAYFFMYFSGKIHKQSFGKIFFPSVVIAAKKLPIVVIDIIF